MKRIGIIMIALMLAACGGASDQEQTLVADHAILSTEIVNIRETATREADRLAITLEHAQTEVRRTSGQGTALASTLIASGIDPSLVTPGTPILPAANIPGTPAPTFDLTAAFSGQTTPPSQVDPNATPVPVTPFTITPTEMPPPRIANIVTSDGVGANDCAINSISQFSTTSEAIYVVAVASSIQPGMTITSRWKYEGADQVTFDFVPDFVIDEACVWFYIEPSDVAFTPGNWSVTLEINGQPVGAPVPFTIAG